MLNDLLIYPFYSYSLFIIIIDIILFLYYIFLVLTFWYLLFNKFLSYQVHFIIIIYIFYLINFYILKIFVMWLIHSLIPLPSFACIRIICGLIYSINFEYIIYRLSGHMNLFFSHLIYLLALLDVGQIIKLYHNYESLF